MNNLYDIIYESVLSDFDDIPKELYGLFSEYLDDGERLQIKYKGENIGYCRRTRSGYALVNFKDKDNSFIVFDHGCHVEMFEYIKREVLLQEVSYVFY